MINLCKHLSPILKNDLENGNQVLEFSNGWSNAEMVYDMSRPLNIREIITLSLDNCVVYWENQDTHYRIQLGYYCNVCKHSIAGPST
jgi:hypothetical protein